MDGIEEKYKKLLKKYIAHVEAAEGATFAFGLDMAPCDMGKYEYTKEDKDELLLLFDSINGS